ncbi:MAG TPA: threonylcarbamoyl-AMP synthase [Actinobacteria bacterium]|nr:threonylcarbamoyl-AMP synthase [Actinomycetota bacterium]
METVDDALLDEAVAAVKAGEIVGLPTDTLYGLGVDPMNPGAIERLFALKGRPGIKPLALLVADLEQAQTIGVFDERALELAEAHWPGALTIVVPKLPSIPEWIGDRARRTVGLRRPRHPVAVELLRRTGPLAVTSANPSGGAAALDDDEARELFGDRVAVYLPGRAPGGAASTVVDVTAPTERVLRPGPISP